MKNDHQSESTLKYEVKYGPKKETDRETKQFSDETQAINFFNEKDKAGMHVDAYTVETVVTRKKLTK